MDPLSAQLRRINFITTNRCNVRCIYCPQGSHPDEYYADLTPEFFEEIFEFIKDGHLAEAGFGYYGEITMIEGWWKPVRRLIDSGILVSATTNGSTLLSPDEVATFARFKYIEWRIDTHDVDILKHIRKKVDVRTIVHNFHLVRSYCLLHDLPLPDLAWTGVLTIDVAETLPQFVAYASSCGAKTLNFNEVGIYDGAPIKGLNIIEQDDATFERAAESVRKAIELGEKFGIKMHIAEWPRIKAKRLAIKEGREFSPMVVTTSTPVAEVRVHTEGNELPPGYTRSCSSPWDEFYLDPKGQVFACCVRGDVMGIAKSRDELKAVLENDKYRALRKSLMTGIDLDNACANCILRPVVPVQGALNAEREARRPPHSFIGWLRERIRIPA